MKKTLTCLNLNCPERTGGKCSHTKKNYADVITQTAQDWIIKDLKFHGWVSQNKKSGSNP